MIFSSSQSNNNIKTEKSGAKDKQKFYDKEKRHRLFRRRFPGEKLLNFIA
jgi:hypothetical protein